MTTPEPPSRFHASPTEIDAFLRQHLAEDVLLNFYRAVGDEVLDEALTHGKQYRARKAADNGKHVYLAGMQDVMDEIWDYRYYPAQLPRMDAYNRPFNPPREQRVKAYVREVPGGWVALRDNDPSKVLAQAVMYDDLERKLSAFPYPVLILDPNCDPVPDTASFDDLLDASSLEAPHVRTAVDAGPPIPHDIRERLTPITPPSPEPDGFPCYRTKAHEPHQWLKGRRAVPCPGIPKGAL